MTRGTPWGWWAASVCLLLMAGCAPGETSSGRAPVGTTASPEANQDWRWVGLRGVEVLAPSAWGFDYEAVRPDCIDPEDPHGRWAEDVPDAPYVVAGAHDRPVPLIGCLRERRPGDPDPAFGAVPFSLWQPFVKLEPSRPDLEEPGRADGRWEYQDWRLTRQTISGVQVTVLAPPDRPTLGRSVLGSARQVQTTALGCEATSPVQAERFAQPRGPSIPAATSVQAIAVCRYSRLPGGAGLEGSRRITGQAAQALVEAIREAPRSGGPDRPGSCVHDMYGDSAIALRFFARSEEVTTPLAEAYVYYDWCFGNGIIDSDGARRLTSANCAPLFAEPPIGLWSGNGAVVEACGPYGRQ